MQPGQVEPDMRAALARFRQRFTPLLDGLLWQRDGPEGRLDAATRHALLGGGKQLRPYLVYESARMFGVPAVPALRTGAALEMVHAYSLVHDDLPAMDDDGLRRGRPTCHIAFDEATAILAGDALQALAFETLAAPETHARAEVRVRLVQELARAAGRGGMVGGQILDLRSPASAPLADRRRLASLKTGALFAFATRAGAILAEAPAAAERALAGFGAELGLLFQIVDDLLDRHGDEAAVGKRLRKDDAADRPTLLSRLGPTGARAEARARLDSALAELESFGAEAEPLRATARFVLDRDR